MRDLDGMRHVCYTKDDYKLLMQYILMLKQTEKSCKEERHK